MSKSVITIIDVKGDKVKMRVDFTPAVKRNSLGTPSQRAAVMAMEAILKHGKIKKR